MPTLKPTEFESGNRYEQYSGESQRRRVAAQGAAWTGASAASSAGAATLGAHRLAGRPVGQAALATAGASHPAAAPAIARFAARSRKVAAKPKTALAGTLGLSAAGVGTGIVGRFRANEEQGISQGLGRIKAGSRYAGDQRRLSKGLTGSLANAGLVSSLMGDPASRKAIEWAARNRKPLAATTGVVTAAGGTLHGVKAGNARRREVQAVRTELRKSDPPRAARRAEAKVAPKARYVPTPEQLAAQQAKRDAQAAAKAGKQTQVIASTVKKIPFKGHLNRNQMLNAGLSLGVLGGASALVRNRRQREEVLAKREGRDKVDATLGAAAGAAGVDAAYVVGGQTAKARIKIVAARRGKTPAEEARWAEHKAAAGMKPGEKIQGSTSASVKHKLFARYPTELPGWKAQRVLGWKNHNGVYGGALATGAVGGGLLASRRREVAKSNGFALVGAVTSATGLGVSGRRAGQSRKEEAKEAAAATAGGWAAQGAYQGAGYAAKHRAQAKHGYGSSGTKTKNPTLNGPDGAKIPRTRSQANNRIKAAEKELGHRRGTVAFDRAYPKSLPEYRTHRVLGWTHRGRTGTALGGALTAAGAYGAAELASNKKKPLQREMIGKNVEYGYMERKRSKGRTAQFAAGTGLVAYGGSRVNVGPAVRRGVKYAEAKGYGGQARGAVATGRRYRDTTRRVTGQAETGLRNRVPGFGTALDLIPAKLRPAAALGGGALLAARARPLHDERFTPTGRF